MKKLVHWLISLHLLLAFLSKPKVLIYKTKIGAHPIRNSHQSHHLQALQL